MPSPQIWFRIMIGFLNVKVSIHCQLPGYRILKRSWEFSQVLLKFTVKSGYQFQTKLVKKSRTYRLKIGRSSVDFSWKIALSQDMCLVGTENIRRNTSNVLINFGNDVQLTSRICYPSIIIGDKTWLYHFTPKIKKQSLEWHHSTSWKPNLNNHSDRLLGQERVIERNSHKYAIQNRRRERLSKGVRLLRGNARP